MKLARLLLIFALVPLAAAQYSNAGGKAAGTGGGYVRIGTGSTSIIFSGDVTGTIAGPQTVIGILGQPLPTLAAGYPHWNGTAWVFDTPASSMVWPSGSAGIPNYSGSSTWGTSYNASSPIPANFITQATGTGFPHVTSGVMDAAATTVGGGLAITSGALTTVGQQPYEIGLTVNGVFTSSQVLLRKPTSLAYTIPSGCTNSQVTLGTAVTASWTLSLQKNGVQFGTAVIASGTGPATFTCASSTSFVVGTDVLTIVAPSSADATAANLGGSFYATR